jgi:hypothetical protein
MSRNGRRLLYTEERVRAMFAQMKGELSAQHFRHLCAQADLRKQLDEVRGQFEALRNAVLERERAEANVELLKRDREKQTRIAEGERYWLH